MTKRGAKEKKEKEGFDLPLGGFSKLFKGLENIIDLAEKLKEKGGISQKKEFTIPTGKEGKDIKGVYGFTVRTMDTGEPRVEPFGDIKRVKKTPKGPIVEEVREPIVDVFDEGEHVLIVAEMPGIEKDQVNFEVKGDILDISAVQAGVKKERKYSKEVLLPYLVDEKPIHVSFKNGIFELKFLKKKG